MLAFFYKKFFEFEIFLSCSDQNNTYYLEALTDNERFFYFFSTAIPFFCIFKFIIIQEFLHLCIYGNNMVVISSLGEKEQLCKLVTVLTFGFPLGLNWKWKKWFSTWKKFGAIDVSLVSPLSDFLLHLLHLFLKYQNANSLTFITSAEVRAFV